MNELESENTLGVPFPDIFELLLHHQLLNYFHQSSLLLYYSSAYRGDGLQCLCTVLKNWLKKPFRDGTKVASVAWICKLVWQSWKREQCLGSSGGCLPLPRSALMECSPRGQGSVTFTGTAYLGVTGQQLEGKWQEKNKRSW